MSKPASSARWAAAANSAVTRSMSSSVIALGVWFRGDQGTGEAAITGQFPSASGASMFSQPSRVDPLGPECPSWQQTFAFVSRWMKPVIRFQAAVCSSA